MKEIIFKGEKNDPVCRNRFKNSAMASLKTIKKTSPANWKIFIGTNLQKILSNKISLAFGSPDYPRVFANKCYFPYNV